ncbi:hypothetical protein B0G77_5865 [Paraburkholderia sp. BL10I2N1]|nr:hypothetical protein B0G77_5865 [Paraburkholderia sp. BL10I2N1]
MRLAVIAGAFYADIWGVAHEKATGKRLHSGDRAKVGALRCDTVRRVVAGECRGFVTLIFDGAKMQRKRVCSEG